jgi:hypothetical protein
MQGAIVQPPTRVPIVFDRALTDVLRSRRTVEETKRRLAEARAIIEALERSTGRDPASWVTQLDEAIGHLALVEETLVAILDRQGASR